MTTLMIKGGLPVNLFAMGGKVFIDFHTGDSQDSEAAVAALHEALGDLEEGDPSYGHADDVQLKARFSSEEECAEHLASKEIVVS